MAIGIFKIQAVAAIAMVELAGLGALRISPIGKMLVLNPAKNRVKLRFGNQKSIMLGCDGIGSFHKIERNPIGGFNHLKRPKARGCGKPQNISEKLGRSLAVPGFDNGMVERNGHKHPFPVNRNRIQGECPKEN